MKILIVGNNKPGHFAPFVEEQARALQKQGCEVVFFGVQGKGLMGYLRCLPALKRAIRKHQPDLIHAHYGLSGLLANLQRRVPVVTTYHGSDINVPAVRRFSKIAMRLSAHNIFVSQRNVALALSPNGFITSRLKKRYTLLPCGVNLTDDQLLSRSEARKNLGIDDDAKVVLFAGAFANAVKDAPLAQEAVIELKRMISQPLEGVDSSGNNRSNECEIRMLSKLSSKKLRVTKHYRTILYCSSPCTTMKTPFLLSGMALPTKFPMMS